MMNSRRAFQPLDVIHTEKAFAKVLKRSQKDEFCEWCMRRQINLKACIKCRAVNYCGKDCQKSDWGDHKLECPYMKNLPNDCTEDFVRLLGRIFLKIKDKEKKNVSVSFLNNVVTFNDLKPREVGINDVSLEILKLKQVKKHVERFIGEENIPEENDITELMNKVLSNTIAQNSINESAGLFFFLGSSCLEQECIPTADFVIHKNTLKVFAIKEISKESLKVTINLNTLFSCGFQDYIDTTWKRCRCASCILPYGKSPLTEILNEDAAYSVIKETQIFLKKFDDMWIRNALFTDDKFIEELLGKHIGVLGDTNALHMRLLALKCFRLNCNPSKMWKNLKELEKLMSKVFGEFYLEMLPIYEKLIPISIILGKAEEGLQYMTKAKTLRDIFTV